MCKHFNRLFILRLYRFLLCLANQEELKRQNALMRGMLMCKSCHVKPAARVNQDCGHLLCNECSLLASCGKCGMSNTRVSGVKFAHQK